jgi:hypothetical protein
MKTITTLFAALFCIFANTVCGQIVPTDPRHVYVYNDIPNLETEEYAISIEDVVSNVKYAKFKIKITNKTADYILFKGEECTFVSGSIAAKADEKPVFIDPFSSKSKVIEFKGTDNYHVDNFEITIKGLYKVVVGSNVFAAPDFQLPPNTKDFTAGLFSCSMLKTEQKTQSTWARFDCKYNGQKIGFINPAKCVVKLPDGKEFATANLKSKSEMLLPGDNSKFITEFQIPGKVADMQFTTMNIIWKDSFSETTATALASQKAQFKIDEAKTSVKNKN